MRQKMISEVLKERYGTKVYKLALTSGCTCPNRDGTVGYGGCSFCSEGGSGEFAAPLLPLEEQIREARRRVDQKIPARIPPDKRRYVAYFQSFTNTYGDPERLGALYMEAAMRPEICAVSVGTRPDCLPPDMLTALSAVNRVKPVWVELGLQTAHERTARAVNRCWRFPVYEEAVRTLKALDMQVITHVIFGLPGESREDMLETVRVISAMRPHTDGIKLQQLQVLEGTRMGREYKAHPFPLMSLDEYCDLLRDSLAILPEDVVIHRLTGDGPKALLIAPKWCADKRRVMNTIRKRVTDR